MAITTTTTLPSAVIIADVPHDDRTPLGIPLPHSENSAKLRDVLRLRTALIMLDALVSGIPAQVNAAFAAQIGSAPATLDTIQEISTALQNNPAVITEIMTALGLRATTAQLTTAISGLQGQIDTINGALGGKASAASVTAVADRVTALEAAFPSRARLTARTIALTGAR